MTESGARPSNRPYKGILSYGVQDGSLFFGREGEAEELVSRILASRVTVLHAPCGAGKTSLLSARVIPGLEARCSGAFRILPENDPVAATRRAALQYLLPPPETELDVLRRARAALAAAGSGTKLSALLERYDRLSVDDPARRALITPLRLTPSFAHSGPDAFEEAEPLLSRLLRSGIDVEGYRAHLRGMGETGDPAAPAEADWDPDLDQLAAWLMSDGLRNAYRRLVDRMVATSGDLAAFFTAIVREWAGRLPTFRLVLVYDQFEELFTRFVDSRYQPAQDRATADWRKRDEFFQQFGSLYAAEVASDRMAFDVPSPLPLRFLFSMRDEWVARLDPLRATIGDPDLLRYHLTTLELGQARVAIEHPAKEFGVTYAGACVDQILQELTTEDRFIEPAHLQIVCDKLWDGLLDPADEHDEHPAERIMETVVAELRHGTREPATSVIAVEALEAAGGTQGILSDFLKDYLRSLDSPEDRFDTLEMLDLLITPSGTRNIAEQMYLVELPFRRPSNQRRLLEQLITRTIVRAERRARGRLVEITHEFLVGPIRSALFDALLEPGHRRFRAAIRTLESFAGVDFRADLLRLPSVLEVENLDLFRDRLWWPGWGIELMVRCFVRHRSREGGVQAEALRYWSDRFAREAGDIPEARLLLDRMLLPQNPRRTLALDELRAVNAARVGLQLKREQSELVFRSQIIKAGADDNAALAYWAERVDGR